MLSKPGNIRFDTRPKLAEEVTRYLRDALMVGEFAPGERMAVYTLAKRLGVSTMPVREALVALASEGLLEAIPRRGFRVVKISTRGVEHIFAVHAFVAGLLATEATPCVTPVTIR